MGAITEIPNTRWRDQLLPARFRQAWFHVEAMSKENGRRIVVHEFPKKEFPYSEDMGRKAIEFSVRGYCIAYPQDTSIPLYRRDYRVARDILLRELETEGPGELQMPTLLDTLQVVCHRYRLSEEEKFGGFCVFDMSFVEFGLPPNQRVQSSRERLIGAAEQLSQQVITVLTQGAHV
jgi:prophage DNA circulation protein